VSTSHTVAHETPNIKNDRNIPIENSESIEARKQTVENTTKRI